MGHSCGDYTTNRRRSLAHKSNATVQACQGATLSRLTTRVGYEIDVNYRVGMGMGGWGWGGASDDEMTK